MTTKPALALATACAAALLLSACAGATNPVADQAGVVTGGLNAANDTQSVAALTTSGLAVKGWVVANSRYPTAAEFMAIPGAASSGGASISYTPTAAGFCLTATSAGPPVVVRTWLEPGGLQAAGTGC